MGRMTTELLLQLLTDSLWATVAHGLPRSVAERLLWEEVGAIYSDCGGYLPSVEEVMELPVDVYVALPIIDCLRVARLLATSN